MLKTGKNSLLMRLFAVASIFALSTTVALASPYRRAFFMPNGSYGWSVPSQVMYGQPVPVYGGTSVVPAAPAAVPQQSYQTYGAAYAAPAVPRQLTPNGAQDYMASVTEQGTYRWLPEKLPIKIFIGDGTGTPGYRPEFRQIVANCFDQWCQASGNKLAWTQVTDASKADITVNWTANVTQRPEGTEAGKTDAYTKLNTVTHEGIIYGARMQLLTFLNGRPFSTTDMNKTILHETGHALGLQGHSPSRTDIMYYAINPAQQPVLTDRDTSTLAHLYANYPVQDAITLVPHSVK